MPPGSTTWRAIRSVSTRDAPRPTSRPATVDFPDPIPPVSPIVITAGRYTGRRARRSADLRKLLPGGGREADEEGTTGTRTPSIDGGHELAWAVTDGPPAGRAPA